MKVFALFVGKWKTEATIKPSLSTPTGFVSKGELTGQLLSNGHFFRLEGFGVSERGRFEYSMTIGFNKTRGQFRQFILGSDGFLGEGAGEWNETTKTLTIKGVNMPEGWMSTITLALDKERLVQTGLVKNEKGEIVRDTIIIAERIK